MKPPFIIFVLQFYVIINLASGKQSDISEKDINKYRLDEKGFEKVKTIHTNWYVHSMKALIAQLSRNLLPKLDGEIREEFLDCLRKIHDKKDLVESSKCVIGAKEKFDEMRRQRGRMGKSSNKRKIISNKLPDKAHKPKREEIMKKILGEINPKSVKFGKLSKKSRKTIFENDRKLQGVHLEEAEKLHKKLKKLMKRPFGGVVFDRSNENNNTQLITTTTTPEPTTNMPIKKKKLYILPFSTHDRATDYGSKERLIVEYKRKWRNQKRFLTKSSKPIKIVAVTDEMERRRNGQLSKRVKRSLRRMVVDTVSKSDSSGYEVKSMNHMPNLKSTNSKSPVKKVADLLKVLISTPEGLNPDDTWLKTYETLLKLKKTMSQKEKEPGAKVYNRRMFDLVLDLEPDKKEDEGSRMSKVFEKQDLPSIFRRAFDLMSSIESNGQKRTSDDSNIKFLSPRFASIMPDKNENRGKLSPSILSFYNDDSEDQILSLPKMLEATGMKGKDRQTMMDLVMEVTGAKGIVQEAMKILEAVDMPELNQAISKNAEKSMKMVHEIKSSYNKRQKYEMDNKGFAMMEPEQMRKLMNDQGIGNRIDIFNIEEYAKMTNFQRREMVWDMVRNIAHGAGKMIPGNSTSRVKRQSSVWGPHILQPTVLSPILFTPIYGLNVLGPTVLSPGLFTPLILNPAVLSPYVFSPTVAIPFILSPYVLSPYVFSPLIMAPFILNPYVLSPNVFNPYVLSPLVLSPLVLCPDVVSPMTLGGAILSPGVLSPSILSKSYLMASVLSPAFLS